MKEYGITAWASSFGVCDFKIGIALKRLAKDTEYPNGRFLMSDTQTEWENIRQFLFNDPKTHTQFLW